MTCELLAAVLPKPCTPRANPTPGCLPAGSRVSRFSPGRQQRAPQRAAPGGCSVLPVLGRPRQHRGADGRGPGGAPHTQGARRATAAARGYQSHLHGAGLAGPLLARRVSGSRVCSPRPCRTLTGGNPPVPAPPTARRATPGAQQRHARRGARPRGRAELLQAGGHGGRERRHGAPGGHVRQRVRPWPWRQGPSAARSLLPGVWQWAHWGSSGRCCRRSAQTRNPLPAGRAVLRQVWHAALVRDGGGLVAARGTARRRQRHVWVGLPAPGGPRCARGPRQGLPVPQQGR
jgi:hypothetical protein